MSTLAQMRDTIKNSPDKGPQVRKKNIPDLLLEYWIKVVRNRLIGKGIEKQKSILATLEQDLGCWPLEYARVGVVSVFRLFGYAIYERVGEVRGLYILGYKRRVIWQTGEKWRLIWPKRQET